MSQLIVDTHGSELLDFVNNCEFIIVSFVLPAFLTQAFLYNYYQGRELNIKDSIIYEALATCNNYRNFII
jgi:hypothetical protein